jgi:hypothetical protein
MLLRQRRCSRRTAATHAADPRQREVSAELDLERVVRQPELDVDPIVRQRRAAIIEHFARELDVEVLALAGGPADLPLGVEQPPRRGGIDGEVNVGPLLEQLSKVRRGIPELEGTLRVRDGGSEQVVEQQVLVVGAHDQPGNTELSLFLSHVPADLEIQLIDGFHDRPPTFF